MILKCGFCNFVGEAIEHITYARYECTSCHKINDVSNVPLKEWLGFNYNEFLTRIVEFIDKDEFELLKAVTKTDIAAGMLTVAQVAKLKTVLIDSFENGNTLREIAEKINTKVKPRDLLRRKEGKIVKGKDGKPIVSRVGKTRALAIARTETTRVSSEGALNHYADGGVQEVRWLSVLSPRTCPVCEGLNGTIFSIGEARDLQPVHIYCRCDWTPVTELNP